MSSPHAQRGFTLIELLVVIAIIGVLASVVLGSLSTARSKAANAVIKENLRSINNQIEYNYLSTGSYGSATFTAGPCSQAANTPFADSVVWGAIVKSQAQNGGTMPTCASTPSLWAISAPLRAAEGAITYWCIETEGRSKGISTDITTTTCP